MYNDPYDTCLLYTSHIEFMKTRENILKEKAHIADYLPADGALFVNGDDDLLPTLKAVSYTHLAPGVRPPQWPRR